MNEFFVTVTDSLGINENSNNESASEGISDPVEKSKNTNPSHNFTFSFVSNSRVSAKLRELKINKAAPIGSIPGKILKENLDIFTGILQELFNARIVDGAFPFELKRGEVTSVLKAND